MDIHPGDRVRCVNGLPRELTVGQVYTVLRSDSACVWVDNGVDYGYVESRFERVRRWVKPDYRVETLL